MKMTQVQEDGVEVEEEVVPGEVFKTSAGPTRPLGKCLGIQPRVGRVKSWEATLCRMFEV